MNKLKEALHFYHRGEPLSDEQLKTLLTHFRKLDELVTENPDLKCVQAYTFTILYRLEDYARARKERK